MKTPNLIKTTMLLLGVSAVLLLLPAKNEPQLASCSKTILFADNGMQQISIQCNQAPQPSWSSWFSGNSRSTQFHFIDLLELLSRFQHKSS
jgi:hypothetical protein